MLIEKATFKLMGKAAFVNSVGRVPNLDAWIGKLSCWIRFSRWCIETGGEAGRYSARPSYPYSDRYRLYESVIEREHLDVDGFDYLEFGVCRGESIAWWSQHISHAGARFTGFDTFTGLPEQWHVGAPAGTFSNAGMPPAVDDTRVRFEVGLFQDTLPGFLRNFARGKRLVLHLDADLYSSTLFVLASVAPLLQPGDLLFFDEFATPNHEFLALDHFVRAFGFEYRVIGMVNNFNQLCLKAINMAGASRSIPQPAS
jgi:O-methyltransferase